MNARIRSTLIAILISGAIAVHAATLTPIHANCKIGVSEESGKFSLQINNGDCSGSRHCGMSNSNELSNRFTGITLTDLSRDGAHLTATLAAEAGTFTCTGAVREKELSGDAVFTPDASFVERMAKLGFTGFDSEKLQAYALVNVESRYAQSLQQADIRGINIDNLIALRIFNVDPAYMQSIVALGYEKPDADKLIALKVQGVNAEEVREIRSLGFRPSLDELIQIRIFKITPDFVHRMQDRGFKNLTIAKLVQIRIFNLAE
jgi:hypothetical protein